VIQPPLHLRLRDKLDRTTERLALRATLAATHLLGLATGAHLRELRGRDDPLLLANARLQEAEIKARLSLEVAEILASRFAKIPERHRPYYSPTQRFRILEIKNLLGWSARDTASTFLLCPHTILNWERAADPVSQTVGVTVRPTPPVRRAADVVRALVQTMARLGFGGQDLIARTLARAGWTVSARSVGRYRREKPAPAPTTQTPPRRLASPVCTRFVHHTWMMDVTQIRQFLGTELHLAAVFDAHSRVPLLLRAFDAMPGAADMAALLRHAGRAFGSPRYLVTDLGGEFTGALFAPAVAGRDILHRSASADNSKATARLERFWRSLKEMAGLRGLQLALTVDDLERRIELALLHYLCFRSHEGLGGATPVEVFLDLEPAHLSAIEPPRGMPGEGGGEAPFRLAFLDESSRRFPVLTQAG